MIASIAAVSTGAALGALLRWLLATEFNALSRVVPLGTLAANLLGGYLIGLAVDYFANHAWLPPQWRLFVVTGFLGGLTTFSTFSAEVVINLLERRLSWALAIAVAHLLGSIAMTLLGIATMSWWRGGGT